MKSPCLPAPSEKRLAPLRPSFSIVLGMLSFQSSAWSNGVWYGRGYNGEILTLGDLGKVGLEVFDDVSGKCWTNVNAVRSKMTQMLESRGLSVVPNGDPFEMYVLSLSVAGKRAFTSDDSPCFGGLEFQIFILEPTIVFDPEVGILNKQLLYEKDTLVLIDEKNMNNEIIGWVASEISNMP